jgi:anti-sigma-K factor RskA
MRRRSNRILLAGALAAIAAAALYSQSKDAQPEGPAIFRADTRLVVLHASVVDKNGKLVTNLTQKSFHVFENNVEQPIKKLLREDVPVSMGLIVPSGSGWRLRP